MAAIDTNVKISGELNSLLKDRQRRFKTQGIKGMTMSKILEELCRDGLKYQRHEYQEALKEKKKTNIEVKKRNRPMLYSKHCWYCLNLFHAGRTDAKYCSNRCRKAASIKGNNYNDYGSPAAHFHKKLLIRVIMMVLENNNKEISIFQRSLFTGWLDIARDLFDDLLPENDRLKSIGNDLHAILTNLRNASDSHNLLLIIPPIHYETWSDLVEQFKNNIGELQTHTTVDS